jgi:hypothetical protein
METERKRGAHGPSVERGGKKGKKKKQINENLCSWKKWKPALRGQRENIVKKTR